MKIAKKEINNLCAILIVIVLIISDMALIGKEAVSYALDMVRTNNNNVSFSAYFMDENGNKVERLERDISEEDNLYVDVNVANEGYFDGSIYIENGNLKLSQEIISSGIENIEGNRVDLKQINAGEVATIKLKVQAVVEDTMTLDLLDTETQVSLKGNYINSKNIEKGKYDEIDSQSTVRMRWLSSQELKTNLETNVVTNSIITINGEEKRLIQIGLKSKLEENKYPIKTSKFEVEVGDLNAEEVTIYGKDTSNTNSKLRLEENDYTYNKEEGKILFDLENLDEKAISWNKNCSDEIIISLLLNKDEIVNGKEVKAKSEILTYDDKTLTAESNCFLGEEKEGIITREIINNENEIYKGNLYIGKAREYEVEDRVDISYAKAVQGLEINENETTFVAGGNNIPSEITYREVTFSKTELEDILGTEGQIVITTEQNEEVLNAKVSELVANEEGNITLKLNEGIKELKITLSKPQKQGRLVFKYTKQINNSIYNRSQIDQIGEINQTNTIKTVYENRENITNIQNSIKLIETTSQAELTLNQENIEGGNSNNEIMLMATLKQNKESEDVYSNPKLKIELPEDVVGITSAKCKLVHAENFKLGNAQLVTEDGRQKIEIALDGEQKDYYADGIDGLDIVIYAELDVANVEEPKEETVKLYYENENKQGQTYETEQNITIMPKVQEISAISENVKIEETENLKIEVSAARGGEVLGEILKETDSVYEGETVKYNITLTNKTGESINNIQVTGKTTNAVYYDLIPYEVTFLNGDTNPDNIMIYHKYGNTDWNEKKFDIIDTLGAGESINLSYQVVVKQSDGDKLKTDIKIETDGKENIQTVNYGENPIKNSNAELNLKYAFYEEECNLNVAERTKIYLSVENTSRK